MIGRWLTRTLIWLAATHRYGRFALAAAILLGLSCGIMWTEVP